MQQTMLHAVGTARRRLVVCLVVWASVRIRRDQDNGINVSQSVMASTDALTVRRFHGALRSQPKVPMSTPSSHNTTYGGGFLPLQLSTTR